MQSVSSANELFNSNRIHFEFTILFLKMFKKWLAKNKIIPLAEAQDASRKVSF